MRDNILKDVNLHSMIFLIYPIKAGTQKRGTECGEDGEFSRRLRGMFKKIPENIRKDSGECSRRFWGMFEKIPGNVREGSGKF